MSEDLLAEISADGYAEDATGAVKVAQNLLGKKLS
jgi:methanogenic corrinoid protein MtbC1